MSIRSESDILLLLLGLFVGYAIGYVRARYLAEDSRFEAWQNGIECGKHWREENEPR